MIPQDAPGVAYRTLEYLLGRVPSLSSTEAFTTDSNVTQTTEGLKNGTAPQGYAVEEDENDSDASPSASSSVIRTSFAARSGPSLAGLIGLVVLPVGGTVMKLYDVDGNKYTSI
ncbi:hypothetical protein SBRCBS47491_006913 [Sporothrix bragantina]|uniref:Uncharacterized protein n=1 Tax=Sporothrix bragantina TaxID=671064 RepID=A0ABP0C974_9PEZI